MRCLVTGAAGFIGSHLCEQLVRDGHDVVGLDAFIPYYPRAVKERNLQRLRLESRFTLYERDLRTDELEDALNGAQVVFHLAAMPGLVRSWSDFGLYASCNLEGTQRLLEASRHAGIRHFIHGSTSSVYGKMAVGSEDSPLRPYSPYGVTKLSAEHLCQAYAQNFDLPVTILRLFSVYGPRQRPDMAYHIFARALLADEPLIVFGDGKQSRSNTYVTDCVSGMLAAWAHPEQSIGATFNIGGGQIVELNRVIAILADLLGVEPRITYSAARVGDQRETAADISKANRLLGYAPSTTIEDGLRKEIFWLRELLAQPVL
ncbi:MAG: NAD-dependent epimerase/dehydratase family protein [Ktedonobacterales bacterium]